MDMYFALFCFSFTFCLFFKPFRGVNSRRKFKQYFYPLQLILSVCMNISFLRLSLYRLRESLLLIAFSAAAFAVVSCAKSDEANDKSKRSGSSLPEIKMVPAFSGFSQNGENFQSLSLKGSVWLAYFFFTSCGGPCPAMNAHVETLQQEFPSPSLRFVGVSVDPENDDPPTLKAYAERFHANAERWIMLQMPLDSVRALAVKGFMLAQGSENDPNLHSTRFVVIDKRGMIRGYFDGLDDEQKPKLRRAITELLAEE
jgi:protein SCO1/2